MNPLMFTPVAMSPVFGVSTVELTIRMIVALGVVVLTITTGTRLIRHYRTNTVPGTDPIEVVYQHQLSKHTQLTLLNAGTRQLLIASNPTNTTLLAQGPDLTTPQPTTTTTPATKPAAKPAVLDIRPKPRNPIRHLQNKTVRRA